jgi:hypothetical protein
VWVRRRVPAARGGCRSCWHPAHPNAWEESRRAASSLTRAAAVSRGAAAWVNGPAGAATGTRRWQRDSTTEDEAPGILVGTRVRRSARGGVGTGARRSPAATGPRAGATSAVGGATASVHAPWKIENVNEVKARRRSGRRPLARPRALLYRATGRRVTSRCRSQRIRRRDARVGARRDALVDSRLEATRLNSILADRCWSPRHAVTSHTRDEPGRLLLARPCPRAEPGPECVAEENLLKHIHTTCAVGLTAACLCLAGPDPLLRPGPRARLATLALVQQLLTRSRFIAELVLDNPPAGCTA